MFNLLISRLTRTYQDTILFENKFLLLQSDLSISQFDVTESFQRGHFEEAGLYL